MFSMASTSVSLSALAAGDSARRCDSSSLGPLLPLPCGPQGELVSCSISRHIQPTEREDSVGDAPSETCA
eukprot:766518-Hanusia_phi.AAC.6